MPNLPNYYDILHVAPHAPLEEIKRAYREQMRQVHPDRFVAERARLEQVGLKIALDALDKEIERAKLQSQRMNEAYAVLSDTEQRARYDRQRAEEAERRAEREAERRIQRHYTHMPDDPRTTQKARPHRPNSVAKAQTEGIPWVLLVILILVVGYASSQFMLYFWNESWGVPQTYRPNAPTAVGVITSHQLQATEDRLNATRVYLTEQALLPTATPRNVEDNRASARVFHDLAEYGYALELYGRAIAQSPHDATLYYERGLSYLALYEAGDAEALALALSDFEQALGLLPDYGEVYRTRGLLYSALWQSSGADTRPQALADLRQFQTLHPEPDSEVEEALSQLQSSSD